VSNKTVIIGAGFSAAVFSKLIKQSNILIFDKGKGPGGRSSTRRITNVGIFDHGLQFINSENKEFLNFLKKNLFSWIKEWKGDFIDFDKNQKLTNDIRYIGINGNNDFVKQLICVNTNYQKELCKITKKFGKWILEFKDGALEVADILILTIPAEQCKNLIKYAKIDIKLKGCMEPNLTTMVAFDKNLKISGSGFKFKKNSVLGWVANESSKLREANNPNLELWTLQSSLIFAQKNIQEYRLKKEQIMNLMINEFMNIFNIKNINIVHKDIHGWLYAYKLEKFENNFFWNQEINLGICGDWMCGSTAESAWRSAKGLADQINKS
jgi:renalase